MPGLLWRLLLKRRLRRGEGLEHRSTRVGCRTDRILLVRVGLLVLFSRRRGNAELRRWRLGEARLLKRRLTERWLREGCWRGA